MRHEHYCTCDSGKKLEVEGHTKMRLTEVDNEGICIHCNHYALKCTEHPLDYKGTKYQTELQKRTAKARAYMRNCNSKDYSKIYDPSYINEAGLIE